MFLALQIKSKLQWSWSPILWNVNLERQWSLAGSDTDYLSVKISLLFNLMEKSLVRRLVRFHMAPDRQPLIQLGMMNQENLMVINNKTSGHEVSLH